MISEKHGVYITRHKDSNTKKIYYRGNLMATYRHQPKTIRFKSPLVNDANQDLCGGWCPLGMQEEDESVNDPMLRQLLGDRKPLGFLFADSKKGAEAMARDVRRLRPNLELRILPPGPHRLNHTVAVAQPEQLMTAFDLDTLYEDYLKSGVLPKATLDKEFLKYECRTLISFAEEYDIDEGVPPWVTGLVLGYPIENTISLYREGRV
jgi:hypothetical protein